MNKNRRWFFFWIAATLAAVFVPPLWSHVKMRRTMHHLAVANVSTGNAKMLGAALEDYVQEHEGVLPPMESTSAVRAALTPYLQQRWPDDRYDRFLCPYSDSSFMPNAALSRKNVMLFDDPGNIVAFYSGSREEKGMTDSHLSRIVVFANGNAKMVTERAWQTLRSESGIP